MKKTDLNEFNVGGTHSQNPIGGIPQGGNNTVEQGETRLGDFVFSNRIILDKDTISQFNLSKSFEGKTVSDISKSINNKFKERGDKISESTKNKMLDVLAQAQESIKQKQSQLDEALANNATEPVLPEKNQMFAGGNMETNNLSSVKGAIASSAGPYGQLFSVGNQLGTSLGQTVGGEGGSYINSLFNPEESVISNWKNDNMSTGKKLLGTAIPLLGTAFANKFKKEEAAKQQQNQAINNFNIQNSDFAYGGDLNQFPSFANNWNDSPFINFRPTQTEPDTNFQPVLGRVNTPKDYTDYTAKIANGVETGLNKTGNWLGNNYGNLLRYAPVVGNALELSKMKSPGYERLNRLSNRYKPEYVDERVLQNNINNDFDNTVNSLSSITNGSQGSLRNNILAAGLNRSKALSDAYLRTSDINRQQNQTAQQFNLGIDQVNLNQANQELDINDRNKASYDTNRSKLKSALYEDIGNIGKEEVFKKMIKTQFGYNWLGEYMKNNPNATPKEVEEAYNNQITTSKQNKLGGLMLKKK